MALAFTLPFLMAHDGGIQDLLEGRRSVDRIFLVWNYAFLCLGAMAFLTQTTVELINVLSGEMSLVGPRPHAVAHDCFFEKEIAAYSRRLNVRPGITGWAQVNGLRARTETTEAMR